MFGVHLPQFRYSKSGVPAFKLSVRLVAASVPGLAPPGVLSQQRPFIEASLGSSRKETEFADFDGNCHGNQAAFSSECPWRFGDTLTFKASMEDVMGPGLRLMLRVRKDIGLGPLHLEMRATDVGVTAVSLRDRALPACVNEKSDSEGTASKNWLSPVMLVPLTHVRNGLLGAHCGLGEAVATIALVFIVDVDPDALSEALGPKAWPLGNLGQATKTLSKQLGEKVGEKVGGLIRWLDEPLEGERWRNSSEDSDLSAITHVKHDNDARQTGVVATSDAHTASIDEKADGRVRSESLPLLELDDSGPGILMGPDLNPEGWLCLNRPDGRQFWHHKALGPPPWDSVARTSSATESFQDAGATQSHGATSQHRDTSTLDRTRLSEAVQASHHSERRDMEVADAPVEAGPEMRAAGVWQRADIARTPPPRRPQRHELRQLDLSPVRCERGLALDFGAAHDPVPCHRGLALDFVAPQKAVEPPWPYAQSLMPVHQHHTLLPSAQTGQDRMMAQQLYCQSQDRTMAHLSYCQRPVSMPGCAPLLVRTGWEFTTPGLPQIPCHHSLQHVLATPHA